MFIIIRGIFTGIEQALHTPTHTHTIIFAIFDAIQAVLLKYVFIFLKGTIICFYTKMRLVSFLKKKAKDSMGFAQIKRNFYHLFVLFLIEKN